MPKLSAWWWMCLALSSFLPHTGLVPPAETPEKKEMLVLVEMGR